MSRGRLSICIPTHHGRRDELSELLDSIESCLGEPGVTRELEVIVSDNASRDGTDAMIAARQGRLGGRLHYHRNKENLGLTPNVLAATGLATGDHIWIIGSDDLLFPRALARVSSMLEQAPDRGGYTVSFQTVERAEPALRGRPVGRAYLPAGDERAEYAGRDAILRACAGAWVLISNHIVAADAFRAAADREAPRALRHGTWPQMVIFSEIARSNGRWLWWPAPVVRYRGGHTFLLDEDELGPDLIRMMGEVAAGLDAVWADLDGGRTELWRSQMATAFEIVGRPEFVREWKLGTRTSARSEARALGQYARAFRHVPEYRRRTLWIQAAPARLLRRLAARASASAPMAPLTASGQRAAIDVEIPAVLGAGTLTRVAARVTNRGDATWRSCDPHPVHVGARWWTEAGAELSPEDLGLVPGADRARFARPVGPRETASAEALLFAPRDPGRYRVRLAPVQELVAWFDEVDPAARCESWVAVESVEGLLDG